MTAGQPAAYHTDSRAHSARQEAEIRALLARGIAETVIASAVGCAVARVRHVATSAPTPPPPVPEPRAVPAKLPTPRTTAPRHQPADLLAAARGHDDPRITQLAAHIRGDLDTLAALLRIHTDRTGHVAALLADDRRVEVQRRAYAQRHPTEQEHP